MTEQTSDLQEYAATRSPEAFARLADRYVDIVYSAAARQMGNAEAAQDVTQAVFIVLAQKAATLRPEQPLSAWLLQVTRYAAANARREKNRRDHHERRAGEMALRHAASSQRDAREEFCWDELSPLLDEGLCKLRAKDRDVLVLRYFEKKSAREAGETLGISADAAEKRAQRAIERLRDFFRRRGISVGAAGLVCGLTIRSAEAAPVAVKTLAASMPTSMPASLPTTSSSGASALGQAAAGNSTAGVIAKGAVAAMAAAKVKLIAASVVIGLFVIGGGVVAVKTMIAPTSRIVPLRSNVAPAIASFADAPPGTVTFSDGTRVGLIGVTDTPGKATRWWSADGTAVAAPKPLPALMLRFVEPNTKIYQFELLEISPGASHKQVYVDSPASRYQSASGNHDIPDGARIMGYATGISSDLTSADLSIYSPSAPPNVDWRYEVKPAAGVAATRPAGVTIGKIYDDGRRVRVEVRDDRPTPANAMVSLGVITKRGQRLGAVGMSSSRSGPIVYAFNAAAKDVIAVERTSQPLEIWTIHNVSLRPDVKTDVKVEPLATAATSQPEASAATRTAPTR